jgi:uncharacterized protein YaaR (DUF327 family)
MKVADVGVISKDAQSVAMLQERQPETGEELIFRRQLTALHEAQYQEYIENLKGKIFEQGETLKKKADICGFLKYRQLIAELVGEAASNAYESSKSGSFDIRGKHKVFTIIKKVNGRLDEMAQEILTQQSDNIKLLQMVDDIRGLIVDMFL